MKRHRLDPFSLVFGVVSIAIGLRHIGGARAGSFPGPGWLLPVVVIAVGALIVASAARALTGSHERPHDPDV